MSREVVIVSGVRSAIGTYGGSLKDIAPTELAAQVVREALKRANTEGQDVGHVVFGHVVNTEPKDMYLSRVAAINGGCAQGTPAFNVNRLCGSGLQAIVSASQSILLGDCDIAIGGGAECMSRAPYASLNMRWGARMGDTKMVDMVVGALNDPFDTVHMGVTAENIAAKWGITRADQDALAVESHNRAQRAIEAGYFKSQILPVVLKSRKGDVVFDTDEHYRPNCTLADLAKLKPAFPGKRHCHGRQRLRHQRRRRRGGADGSRHRQSAWLETTGPTGGLRTCWRGPQIHGHRPGTGQSDGPEKGGVDRERSGRD